MGTQHEGPSFGLLLKRYRRAAYLTQEALAERGGYSSHYISMLERGIRLPPPVTVDLLADALALEPADRLALHAAVRHGATGPSAAVWRQVPSVPMVGRERELASAVGLLRRDDVRLLTLTGPGGVGKSCLADHVAAALGADLAAGSAYVDLAPVSDADGVLPALARALKVRDATEGPLFARLVEVLRGQEILVWLDSMERVLDAAPMVANLLRACPRLKLLATSRAPLRLRHEHEFPVEPLARPVSPHDRCSSDLARYPAVALFIHRAQMVLPDLQIDDEDLAVIADICDRADGLPLAIELAAARLKHLPLRTLRDRLDLRLEILAGGPRDLPARQQRMRDTIAWSCDLLTPTERALFRQLSVFVGTWSLGAAEAVCARDDRRDEVLDGLRALVDQSLVVMVRGASEEARYRMLDTIRDYATEELAATGQVEATRRRHAAYYVRLAEHAEPALQGGDHGSWYRHLEAEHDNLRAALQWLLAAGETELALRLAGAVWRFWQRHGDFREGRHWLEAALATADDTPAAARGKALWGASWLAYQQGDHARGRMFSTTYLRIARESRDVLGMRNALTGLGMAAMEEGQYADAVPPLQEALTLCRQLGTTWYLAASLLNLGFATMHAGDVPGAVVLLKDALRVYRALGDEVFTARTLGYLGYAALLRGDHADAGRLFGRSLRAAWDLQEKTGIAEGLEGLAAVHAATGQGLTAARWTATAAVLREDVGAQPHAFDRAACQPHLDEARKQLGETAWSAAWEEGRAMPVEQAVDQALQNGLSSPMWLTRRSHQAQAPLPGNSGVTEH